jgi:hypothetical protein
MGVPEDDAKGYEDHVRRGRVLLTVAAAGAAQADAARRIFDAQGGAEVRACRL